MEKTHHDESMKLTNFLHEREQRVGLFLIRFVLEHVDQIFIFHLFCWNMYGHRAEGRGRFSY